jgi:hypothetical protein
MLIYSQRIECVEKFQTFLSLLQKQRTVFSISCWLRKSHKFPLDANAQEVMKRLIDITKSCLQFSITGQKARSMIRNLINLEHMWDLLRPTSREYHPAFLIYFNFSWLIHTSNYLLLWKNRCAYALRILIEQRAVVHFFTFKGINPGDIHDELVSVYGSDALVLRTLYKWHKCFAQGRTELFNDPRSGRLLQKDLAEAVHDMLQECSFLHVKDFLPTSDLRQLRDCISCTMFCC